jgi:DUF971 family protein
MTAPRPTFIDTGPTMPIPTNLTIRQQSKILEIAFDDGAAFSIPFELMRVYSPSAEVKGHGPGQEVLQVGKREVGINGVEPVGNYAVKPLFTDGHDSGIFTWDYLYKLGSEHERCGRTTCSACTRPASRATAGARRARCCRARNKAPRLRPPSLTGRKTARKSAADEPFTESTQQVCAVPAPGAPMHAR